MAKKMTVKAKRLAAMKREIARKKKLAATLRRQLAARLKETVLPKRVGRQTVYRGHRIRLFRVDIGADAPDPRISYEAEIFYKGTVSWYERGRTAVEAASKARKWVDKYWEVETGTFVSRGGKKKGKKNRPARLGAATKPSRARRERPQTFAYLIQVQDSKKGAKRNPQEVAPQDLGSVSPARAKQIAAAFLRSV